MAGKVGMGGESKSFEGGLGEKYSPLSSVLPRKGGRKNFLQEKQTVPFYKKVPTI
jgi:hypothetical protein